MTIDATELLVRAMRPGEEEALRAVFCASVHALVADDYTLEQRAAWASAARDGEAWTRRVGQLAPYVAELAGTIVGYADVQPDGWIDQFYIAPLVARRGVGSRLMEHIHDVARERRLPALTSNVSITARPFFEAWGFAVQKCQRVERDGVQLINYRMSKPLAS